MKTIKRNNILVAFIFCLALAFASGCGAGTQTSLNPYVLVKNVNSLDHTLIFSQVYDAFLNHGISTATAETAKNISQ